MTIDPNFIIFYVDSPEKSAAFYTEILGLKPLELSPTFAMFLLKPGLHLGLWSKHTVEPPPSANSGGGELDFEVENQQILEEMFQQWSDKQVTFVQKPGPMSCGFYSFVVADPDGHRLRIFSRHPEYLN